LGSGRLYSGWIGSGIIRFGSFRVRVYIGSIRVWVGSDSVRVISGSDLHRVNRSSGWFGFSSGHIGFRVKSGHYSFGSVRFWVGLISDFRSKSVQLFLMSVWVLVWVIRFGSIGLGHFCQVYLWVEVGIVEHLYILYFICFYFFKIMI